MSPTSQAHADPEGGVPARYAQAVADAERLLHHARAAVRARVDRAGGLDAEQAAGHGLAWLATYVEALRQMLRWAERLMAAGRFGRAEGRLLSCAFGEYLAQIAGGIPMSQGETVRAIALGVPRAEVRRFEDAVADLVADGCAEASKAALAEDIAAQPEATTFGDTGLDETLDAMRHEMRRFALAEVVPNAHEWHLSNSYIPSEILAKLGELGVFSLTIPEAYGGLGLGKEAMCVVSEELSRGYIGVGSLGTRSEIAAELILGAGTDEQKQKYLPRIASAEILPTAVFTEPNTGSDLASLRTRAVREGDAYKITGQKTWITHPVRADLMTLLVRTNAAEPGYKGLSMLLAEKPRGTDAEPFPVTGMSGSEIEVLGYRGMKEYDISFDGFEVPVSQLLGGVEGQGFKQLMTTFEAARIQTAARAVGVAQSAMDLGLEVRPGAHPVRQADLCLPARRQQDRDDGRGDHDRAPAHLFRRAREGRGPPLRPGGRHGQAARRPHRLGQRRQRVADPRRQRLRAGVSGEPRAVRRAHPQHLRGRGGDPGPGDRAAAAGGGELRVDSSPRRPGVRPGGSDTFCWRGRIEGRLDLRRCGRSRFTPASCIFPQ